MTQLKNLSFLARRISDFESREFPNGLIIENSLLPQVDASMWSNLFHPLDYFQIAKQLSMLNNQTDRHAYIHSQLAPWYHTSFAVATGRRPLLLVYDRLMKGTCASVATGARYQGITEESAISFPQLAEGNVLDAGSTWHLAKLPHKIGYYLGFNGITVSGRPLFDLGMGNLLVDPSGVDAVQEELMQIDHRNEEQTEQLFRMLLDNDSELPDDSFYRAGWEPFERAFASSDWEETISNLQSECSLWSHEMLAHFTRFDPLCVQGSHYLMNQVSNTNITPKEAFTAEYNAAFNSLASPNFPDRIARIQHGLPQTDSSGILPVSPDQIEEFISPPKSKDFHVKLENPRYYNIQHFGDAKHEEFRYHVMNEPEIVPMDHEHPISEVDHPLRRFDETESVDPLPTDFDHLRDQYVEMAKTGFKKYSYSQRNGQLSQQKSSRHAQSIDRFTELPKTFLNSTKHPIHTTFAGDLRSRNESPEIHNSLFQEIALDRANKPVEDEEMLIYRQPAPPDVTDEQLMQEVENLAPMDIDSFKDSEFPDEFVYTEPRIRAPTKMEEGAVGHPIFTQDIDTELRETIAEKALPWTWDFKYQPNNFSGGEEESPSRLPPPYENVKDLYRDQ